MVHDGRNGCQRKSSRRLLPDGNDLHHAHLGVIGFEVSPLRSLRLLLTSWQPTTDAARWYPFLDHRRAQFNGFRDLYSPV